MKKELIKKRMTNLVLLIAPAFYLMLVKHPVSQDEQLIKQENAKVQLMIETRSGTAGLVNETNTIKDKQNKSLTESIKIN